MQFWVEADHDAHITLSKDKTSTDNIEIVIGRWGDSESFILKSHQLPEHDTGFEDVPWLPDDLILDSSDVSGRLDGEKLKPFWITWRNGHIIVGEGEIIGENGFLEAHSSQDIYYFGISTGYGAPGRWRFAIEFGK